MPITIKCPDCGHTEESKDGASKTCPECEGTMAAPAKKKYQAKTASLEEEERARKKSKRRDDDEEDEAPKKKSTPRDDDEDEPKGKKKPRDDDEEEENEKSRKSKPGGKKGGGPTRDGTAAESLGIDTGFKSKELMRQVEEKLDSDEVLHWAARMRPGYAKDVGGAARLGGFIFAGAGVLFCLIVLAVLPGMMKVLVVVPLLFVGLGIAVATLLPGVMAKQAARGWYAVTNRRAIVFRPSLFSSSGQIENYEPEDLGKMRVLADKSKSGTGDLVFKTKSGVVGRSGGGAQAQTINYGFLAIDNVYEVETLVRKVLLGQGDDDDDE